jgi:Rhamnogalacturonan I lyases beta-sheet domain
MAGCGAVGEPLPPLLDIPVPATGLIAVQRGEQIQIAWPAPNLTTEGVAVRPGRLGSTLLYRAVLDGLRSQVSVGDFAAVAKEAARVEAGRIAFTDPIEAGWDGHTVVYAIQLPNLRGEVAGYSNLAAVAVLKPPPAPAFHARVSEPAVILEWTAQPGAAYRVYRDGQLLGKVSAGVYEDRDFEFDRKYQYTVRGLAQQGDFVAESADSEPVSVTPVDIFPPQAPRGVSAVRVENAVDLSWTPNTEGDLAGYIVYRNGTRLNPALLALPSFRDSSPGASPRYTVKAVDRKGNESAASQEAIP